MFTRIAKGILIISSIAILLLAIIAAISTDGNGLVFFAIIILGGIFLFNFGIFVELANNVMDIKEFLVKDTSATMKHLSKESNTTDTEMIPEDKWKCSKCGSLNQLDTTWCTFCGKQTK